MNSYVAVTTLALAAAGLFSLPLIPAILELRRKSDAQPLSVIQQHTGEIRHFSDSFRGYIRELEPVLQTAVRSGKTVSGVLPDKTEYLVLGAGKEVLSLPLRQSDGTCPVLLAAAMDLSLPPDTAFSKDVYVAGRFLGATKNRYRAILGEKEVHLGAESRVMRWVHAVGEFSAGRACQLHGRVSSDRGIQLDRECTFQRLNAPRIEVGQKATPELDWAGDHERLSSRDAQRQFHEGDFEIASGEVFQGNLVARGRLRIGSGARVIGDLKGGQGVVVESGARLEGSLISATTMHIGASCAIHGPIIAEQLLTLATGSRCGSGEHPTTVSAPWIQVEEGVVVFGTLWARQNGKVVTKL